MTPPVRIFTTHPSGDTLHDALHDALAAGIEQKQALDALSDGPAQADRRADELRAALTTTHPDHLTRQETL